MVYQNHKNGIVLIVLSVVFIVIKLFTAVVILADDPTNYLIFRVVPAMDSQLSLSSIEHMKHLILISDENGFIGDNIYYFITSYLWWTVPILSGLYVYIAMLREKSLTKSSSGR